MMVRYTALFLVALVLAGGAFVYTPTIDAQELSAADRARLEAEYAQLQVEIAAQQKIVDETRAKKNTLQGDVSSLNAQIAKAQKEIDAKNSQIKLLGSQISTKNKVIGELSDKLSRNKESLASMLRQERELDEYSLVEIAMSAEDLSSFFSDIDSFISLKREMGFLFTDIKTTKAQTEEEKAALAKTQAGVTDARHVVETKKAQVATDKSQKQVLLNITANQEAEYQKVLAANQAKAAAIRAALFPLRDAGAIQFGDALRFAQSAGKQTGIRPALILAFLSQESNLGANVGQCYLRDNTTGAGVGKNTGTPFANVMKPTRDVAPFLDLSKRLGFDPHNQVVSCPQSIGYGGAMGPAQFIPSTWVMFEARIAAATGHAVPNPWSAEDAIMANALYIKDLGAGVGGYTAESEAACRYFSGSSCSASALVAGYGRSVVAKADAYQKDIDFLVDN